MPYRRGSKGMRGRKPPHLEGVDSPWWTAGSQRSAGTSPTASTPPTTFAQKVGRSGACGNMHAMPTTAMSSGAGAAGSRTVSSRSNSAARRIRCSIAPVVTDSCSAASVVVAERSTATAPAMNIPSASWRCSSTG